MLRFPKMQETPGDAPTGGPGADQVVESGSKPASMLDGIGPVGEQTFQLDAEVFGSAGEDGRPDKVPEKYWDAESKAVRFGDMFTRHQTLEKTAGSITGAPEKGYELNQPKLEGDTTYEIPADDPMVASFRDLAKGWNLSQEAFDQGIDWWVKSNIEVLTQTAANDTQYIADEMAKMGEDAEAQLTAFRQWFTNSLDPKNGAEHNDKLLAGMKDLITSEGAYHAAMHLASLARKSPLPMGPGQGGTGLTEAEVLEMQNKVDPDKPGERLYDNNPAYREKVTAAWREVRGDGEANEEINFKFK